MEGESLKYPKMKIICTENSVAKNKVVSNATKNFTLYRKNVIIKSEDDYSEGSSCADEDDEELYDIFYNGTKIGNFFLFHLHL